MPRAPLPPPTDAARPRTAARDELEAAVLRVVRSGRFVEGPEVAALEVELAAICGVEHAVAVASGSAAHLVALTALEIGPGDEVLASPLAPFSGAAAVRLVGARPVFVDVDPETLTIDPLLAGERITPRTRAILPTHLFGRCAAMQPILALAERHGLVVVEDVADSLGAEDAWTTGERCRAGSTGTVGCLSFAPHGDLGALGDAGAVVTNDDSLAARLRVLRRQGETRPGLHQEIGGRFRLAEIPAAALGTRLARHEAVVAARRRRAAAYAAEFAAWGLSPGRVVPTAAPANGHVFARYVVRCERRDDVLAYLADRGSWGEIPFRLGLQEQVCLGDPFWRNGDLPRAERAVDELLALPVDTATTFAHVRQVVESIGRFFGLERPRLRRAA